MAGWKYAKVTGSTSNLSSDDAYKSRAREILANLASALISCGWTLDARFSSVSEPHVLFEESSSANYYIALILQNSAGAKLLMAYSCEGMSVSDYCSFVFADEYSYTDMTGGSDLYRHSMRGLILSMLPPGFGEDFDLDQHRIPLEATRLAAMAHSTGSGGSLAFYTSTTALTYTYHVLTKGNVVIVLLKTSADAVDGLGGIVVGEIFGSLAHEEDSVCGCKYGAFDLASKSSESSKASGGVCLNSFFNSNFSAHTSVSRSQSFSFRRANGSHVPDRSVILGADTNQLNTTLCSCASSTARYVPLWMAESSDNPAETGVVSDDGFKGYISTDILRIMRADKFTNGQLFNGGNFVYIGGGVALAWDPSITESIF